MGKRGQITLFIIIGLIILLSITFFIYWQNITIEEPDFVPPQFNPIKDYVSNCIDIIGKQAIEKAGQQSGFIEVPSSWALDMDSYIAIDDAGLLRVPYWYYMGESRIPSIQTIEQQISDYVEQNLHSCLDDFNPFTNTFDITEKRDIAVVTTIDKEDVRIEADYLLHVKYKADGEVTYLSDFSGVLDVKLQEAYELAVKIMQKENQDYLLENATVDIIAMHPDIPNSGMTFSCGQQAWYLQDIKEKLSSVMRYQISRVRIQNTNHLPFLASRDEYEYFQSFTLEDVINGQIPDRPAPADAYEYNHYYFDVDSPESDLRVNMEYRPGWGMDLTARPSQGGVLRSNVGKGAQEFLSFMCVNFYHFTYDISYPVMVIVGDEEAFDGAGFTFRFAFPVLIKKNEGNRVDFGTDIYDVPLEYIDYCGDISGPQYSIKVKGVDDEGYSDMDLKNVNISYDCYKWRCDLGKTGAQQGVYRLITQLPSFCSHGYLVAEKEGYLAERQQVLNDNNIIINMKKLNTFTFDVVMHDYQSLPPPHLDPTAKVLKKDAIAIINLMPYNESGFVQYKMYPSESDDEQSSTIQIIDDEVTYRLDIMLTDERFGIVGGYRGNWSVGRMDQIAKNHITFHVINYLPIPIQVTDQFKLTNFLDENTDYKTQIMPQFTVES